MWRYFLGVIIVCLFIFESCFSGKQQYEAVRIKGSDSEVNLVQALAENFMDRHDLVSIGVTGGGSGSGIASLINNKTDLANSSRAITEMEVYYAKQREVDPYEIVFAQDALALIVNENNPVDSLTLQELADLYRGGIKNWSEVGGVSDDVVLYGRQSSSGTYLYFREHIVQDEYDHSMIGMSGTAQIVEAIRQDENGIGYVSSGYLDESIMKDLKVVKIKLDASTLSYSPLDTEAIVAGKYPITRPLMQYSNGKPQGRLLDFVLYQFTPEGAEIISSNGFYPVSAKHAIAALTGGDSIE